MERALYRKEGNRLHNGSTLVEAFAALVCANYSILRDVDERFKKSFRLWDGPLLSPTHDKNDVISSRSLFQCAHVVSCFHPVHFVPSLRRKFHPEHKLVEKRWNSYTNLYRICVGSWRDRENPSAEYPNRTELRKWVRASRSILFRRTDGSISYE